MWILSNENKGTVKKSVVGVLLQSLALNILSVVFLLCLLKCPFWAQYCPGVPTAWSLGVMICGHLNLGLEDSGAWVRQGRSWRTAIFGGWATLGMRQLYLTAGVPVGMGWFQASETVAVAGGVKVSQHRASLASWDFPFYTYASDLIFFLFAEWQVNTSMVD
jgi:hypothetical protein